MTGDPSAAQSAQVLAEQMWLRDDAGWRREWLVGRLSPLTNYSVYAIQNGTRLSGPIYFTTKSGLCQVFLLQSGCVLTTGSVILLSARPRPAVLSEDGIQCTPSRTAQRRTGV